MYLKSAPRDWNNRARSLIFKLETSPILSMIDLISEETLFLTRGFVINSFSNGGIDVLSPGIQESLFENPHESDNLKMVGLMLLSTHLSALSMYEG